ncbi:unnamed protein product, partial [Ceratitis capitata]
KTNSPNTGEAGSLPKPNESIFKYRNGLNGYLEPLTIDISWLVLLSLVLLLLALQ